MFQPFQPYLSFWGTAIFIKIKIIMCKLFQFGSLKFVVTERVNSLAHSPQFKEV